MAKGKSYIPILTLRQINRGIKGPGDQRQWIADDVMLKPAGLEDNQAYAVLVAEKPILPILKQFSRVVVDTLSEVKSGDLVVIKLIDEPTLIAEYSCENDNVILKHYNGGESTCYEKEIQFKHKIVWIKMP